MKPMTHADVNILETQILYQGFYTLKRYTLKHRLFKGGWSEPFIRELLLRHRVAAALPYDPLLDQVVLIEIFRIGALEDPETPWELELVAGLMTQSQPINKLIQSEMQEEAGLIAQELLPICDYWASPGGTNERIALYCAKVDAKNAGGIHGLAEEHEDILVHIFNSAEAFAAVRSGRIKNAATIIALQWLELNLDKVKSKWL